jgi:hypothetical protein
MTVYILNEEGQVWAFSLRRDGSSFEASEAQKSTLLLPRPVVVGIFAGNASIYEAISNG